MVTIEEIVDFNVASVKNIQGREYQFILEDGTLVVVDLTYIKTVEEQKAEYEAEIGKKQSDLEQLEIWKAELELKYGPVTEEEPKEL
jgi:hypothetical protein